MEKDLKQEAAKHFKVNKDVDFYHVTVDGQCFKTDHHANEHAKTIKDRAVVKVKREDVADLIEELGAGSGPSKGETLIDKINACETVDAVNALIKNNSPKAAKEAAKAKITALGTGK